MIDDESWVVEFHGAVQRMRTNSLLHVPAWKLALQITWIEVDDMYRLDVFEWKEDGWMVHKIYDLCEPFVIPHRAHPTLRCWKYLPSNTVQIVGIPEEVQRIQQLAFPHLTVEEHSIKNAPCSCAMYVTGIRMHDPWGYIPHPTLIIRVQHTNEPIHPWIDKLRGYFQVQLYYDPTTFRCRDLDDWCLLLDYGNPTTGMIPPTTTFELACWHHYASTAAWWSTPSPTQGLIARQLASWYRDCWIWVEGIMELHPRLPRDVLWYIVSYGVVPPDVTIDHLRVYWPRLPWAFLPDQLTLYLHRKRLTTQCK